MCWCLRLSPFDVVIVHLPDRKNQVQNTVSLLTRPSEPEYPFEDDNIPAFEDMLFAVTTRSNAANATPVDDEAHDSGK